MKRVLKMRWMMLGPDKGWESDPRIYQLTDCKITSGLRVLGLMASCSRGAPPDTPQNTPSSQNVSLVTGKLLGHCPGPCSDLALPRLMMPCHSGKECSKLDG
jgi:hypothetical protein